MKAVGALGEGSGAGTMAGTEPVPARRPSSDRWLMAPWLVSRWLVTRSRRHLSGSGAIGPSPRPRRSRRREQPACRRASPSSLAVGTLCIQSRKSRRSWTSTLQRRASTIAWTSEWTTTGYALSGAVAKAGRCRPRKARPRKHAKWRTVLRSCRVTVAMDVRTQAIGPSPPNTPWATPWVGFLAPVAPPRAPPP